MTELSNEQLAKIVNEFNFLDTDGSKDISKSEVYKFISSRVLGVSSDYINATVDNFFDKCDANKDGVVTLDEFKNFYIAKLKK